MKDPFVSSSNPTYPKAILVTPYGARQFLECIATLNRFLFTIVLDDPELDRTDLYFSLGDVGEYELEGRNEE